MIRQSHHLARTEAAAPHKNPHQTQPACQGSQTMLAGSKGRAADSLEPNGHFVTLDPFSQSAGKASSVGENSLNFMPTNQS